MIIHYNQQENIELKEGITLNEFLQSKQLSREGVAVAVDKKIVKFRPKSLKIRPNLFIFLF